MTYHINDLIAHYHIQQVSEFMHTICIPVEELDDFKYYEGTDGYYIFVHELGLVKVVFG